MSEECYAYKYEICGTTTSFFSYSTFALAQRIILQGVHHSKSSGHKRTTSNNNLSATAAAAVSQNAAAAAAAAIAAAASSGGTSTLLQQQMLAAAALRHTSPMLAAMMANPLLNAPNMLQVSERLKSWQFKSWIGKLFKEETFEFVTALLPLFILLHHSID